MRGKLALTQALKVLVIRENHNAGEHSLDLLKWGLIPYWCADPKGGRKPINAKSETVAKLPMFRDSYRRRRFILPIDAFYEWRANKGGKQPYAIAMKDRSPFGIAGWPPRTYEPRRGSCIRTPSTRRGVAQQRIGKAHLPDQAADRKRRRRPSPARPRAWVRLTQALVKISYNREQGDISRLHSWQ